MFCKLDGRKFARAKESAEFGNGEKSQVSFGHEGKNLTQRRTQSANRRSKNFLLSADVAERTEVGDDEGDAELIFRTDCAEGDAPIFERDAATAAVVIHVPNLVLQDAIGDVIADPRRYVESFAIEAAVTDKRADLI